MSLTNYIYITGMSLANYIYITGMSSLAIGYTHRHVSSPSEIPVVTGKLREKATISGSTSVEVFGMSLSLELDDFNL